MWSMNCHGGFAIALLGVASACSQQVVENADPESARLTPEMVGAIPIIEPNRFPAEHREAILAATRELRNQEENPCEFFADIGESDEEFVTVVQLWHADAFRPENFGAVGNPGGKCRNMYFDSRAGSITTTLFWQ